MKRFIAFASTFGIKFLLSCSAAVLLSACGGNIDADGGQPSATAAGVTTDAGTASAAAPAAAVEAVEAVAEAALAPVVEMAPAAPAASAAAAPAAGTEAASTAGTQASATAGATGQAAEVTTGAFELTGYGSNPQPPQTTQQDAGANAPALAAGSIQQ